MTRRWRAVVIQKPDLDTCLTGLLLGAVDVADLQVVRARAADADLADPVVLCLECGGSGDTARGNFDHHFNHDDRPLLLPPACVQAFALARGTAPLARLVDYVAAVDTASLPPSTAPPPYLSDVFAGMLLSERGAVAQFRTGMALLHHVQEQELDPFATMPNLPEWRSWLEAKARNDAAVSAALATARYSETARGHRLGFVETTTMGALSALYGQGCQVAIAYSPSFGEPPAPKYTIATRGLPLDATRAALNDLEPGWGGPAHGTILGSPREGTTLTVEQVLGVVSETL